MAEKNKEEQDGGKKSTGRLALIIAAALLLVVGVGVGAYLLGSGKSTPVRSANQGSDTVDASDRIGPMIDIDPFIVNILDNDGTRYLKAALTLEVESSAGRQEVLERMPQLRDAILLVASNKTFDELRDLQGKLQLRAELLARINEIMHRDRVRRIYFTEFVVQ